MESEKGDTLSSLQDLSPSTCHVMGKLPKMPPSELKISNTCLDDLGWTNVIHSFCSRPLREQMMAIWCSEHLLISRHYAKYSTPTMQFKSPTRPALCRTC